MYQGRVSSRRNLTSTIFDYLVTHLQTTDLQITDHRFTDLQVTDLQITDLQVTDPQIYAFNSFSCVNMIDPRTR